MLKLNQNLPRREQPSWLADISHNRILPNKIPLSSILKESCFYPASGTDLTPIEIIAGNVYSFIYCDYSLSKSDVITFFVQKITGLNLIQERFLKENEIERDFWDADHIYDFDEFNGSRRRWDALESRGLFGHWSVWEGLTENINSNQYKVVISLLFLSAEGVSCYQNLFLKNNINPEILAIIQPGHVLGGNWTNFFNPNAPLWNEVKKGVLPDKLLLGEIVSRRNYSLRDAILSPAYNCPFGNDYLIKDAISIVDDENIEYRRKIGIFELDKRTNEQKENDRLKLEEQKKQKIEKNKKDEAERKLIQEEWFKNYKFRRQNYKKCRPPKIKLSHEEDLDRQEFDKKINLIRASYNMFSALKRRDIVAISALMNKGADIYFKNKAGISVIDFAKELGLENLLVSPISHNFD